MRTANLMLAGLLASAPLAGAVAPRADVEVTPGEVTVGDPVTVTLTLRLGSRSSDAEVRLPDWSRGWGDAQLLDVEPPRRQETPQGAEVVQVVHLAAYRIGEIALPPLPIELGGSPPLRLATPEGLHFSVRSLLDSAATTPPRPPAPARQWPVPVAFWWTASSLTLAAAAALRLLGRRRGVLAPGAVARSPLAELEQALAAIAADEPVTGHAALSLALRRYLGRSLAIRAAESTTAELAPRLGASGLQRELSRRLLDLFREVDPVKFACRGASREELDARLGKARSLAAEVELHLHPAPAEEPA